MVERVDRRTAGWVGSAVEMNEGQMGEQVGGGVGRGGVVDTGGWMSGWWVVGGRAEGLHFLLPPL